MLFATYLPMIISYANIIHFFECRTIFLCGIFFLPSPYLQATYAEENSHLYTYDLQSLQSWCKPRAESNLFELCLGVAQLHDSKVLYLFFTIKFTTQSELCNCKVRKVVNYLIVLVLSKANLKALQV